MKIIKKNKTDWIDLDGAKIKVDYPTIDQEAELKTILLSTDLDEKDIINGALNLKNMSAEKKARVSALDEKYMKYYLRYTIKDWEGFLYDGNKEVKCELVGDQLEYELWNDLCRSMEYKVLALLFAKINQALSLNELDKKK